MLNFRVFTINLNLILINIPIFFKCGIKEIMMFCKFKSIEIVQQYSYDISAAFCSIR